MPSCALVLRAAEEKKSILLDKKKKKVSLENPFQKKEK